MYLSNKYTKWYYQIINRAKNRDTINEYTEKHHVIPKCMGGPNTKDNLAKLTAREHFICHRLLTRMVGFPHLEKMRYAAWRMVVRGNDLQERYKPSSRTYKKIREEYIDSQKKRVVSAETCKKISDSKKSISKETCKKISHAKMGTIPWNKGIPRSDDEKKKISDGRKVASTISQSWNTGIKWTDDVKNKISLKAKNREKSHCQHCDKKCDVSNFSRWHGDNCRFKLL